MRRRFFVEKFEKNAAELVGDSAEHLGRVLRAETGQLYELSDGERVWLGRVTDVVLPRHGDGRVRFELVRPVAAQENALAIRLYVSIVKFDRLEWCIEKATELGANEIVPLAAARSEKSLVAAAAKRHTRWHKIALESAQQSRQLRPPVLAQTETPEHAFSSSAADVKVLLSERASAKPLKEILNRAEPTTKSVALAIGPEGGWTEKEFTAVTRAGFAEASLGNSILRTETAVIAALAILRYGLGS